MITYQEYLEAVEKGEQAEFVQAAINKHRQSDEFLTAVDAENYVRKKDTTVGKFLRLIYDVAGIPHVDPVAANYRCSSGFFKQIVTQLTQHLLANGVSFKKEDTKARLGGSGFDTELSQLARSALVEGVSFGFFDFDHVQMFRLSEFAPLWDEETGALMAGIRWWQIASNKPLRADVYTVDGVQSYIRRKDEALKLMEGNENPRPYGAKINKYQTGEIEYLGGVNYPGFPIIPMYANYERQSEIIGLKENIDAYDLTKSGLIDDISDMPTVYWTIENAGGMSEADLAHWRDRVRRNKVSMTDDDVRVTANNMSVPFEAHEAVLTRLERDIYNDAMALNTRELAAGNVTATAVRAASEKLNHRTDELEYCVNKFVKGLLELVGIDDDPQFTRSKITNEMEETQMVLLARDYLDADTIRKHLPFLSTDELAEIADKMAEEAMARAPLVEAE